jgi:hypothetical protein
LGFGLGKFNHKFPVCAILHKKVTNTVQCQYEMVKYHVG